MKAYAAPGSFLLAVTIAVLAVHYGLQRRPAGRAPAQTPVVHVVRARAARPRHASARFVVVGRGDSFSTIAARMHTTAAAIERLNPGVSPTALHVGQRIRVH